MSLIQQTNMENITKKYTNGEITVVWKPRLCIHAAICFTELPKVFIPYERPWIKMENATTEDIMDTVAKCPTQAISYYWNHKNQQDQQTEKEKTEVVIIKNGPFLVKGSFKILDIDGNEIVTNIPASLCRCGQTQKKPFCDGSHIQNNFKIDNERSEGPGS
jgi:CDGSH-type Zn-finger protein/uncharacterized Fe-S cluster protein YjdI